MDTADETSTLEHSRRDIYIWIRYIDIIEDIRRYNYNRQDKCIRTQQTGKSQQDTVDGTITLEDSRQAVALGADSTIKLGYEAVTLKKRRQENYIKTQ